MGRVIVQVATRTGQSVAQVAAASFALTLWTWGELLVMDREAAVERMGDRTDMAGLMAVAFHQPSELQKAEFRYLQAAGALSAMMDASRARMQEMQAKLATARPIMPPPAPGDGVPNLQG